MNFTTVRPGPVSMSIDGIEHKVPRFFLPEMSEWMEELINARVERATGHLNDDDKARFLMYYNPPIFDVSTVGQDIRSPTGAIRFLKRQLPKATPPVSEETIDKLIAGNDADSLRELVEHIASCKIAEATIESVAGAGGKDDPLAKQPRTSEGARSTGSKSTQTSSPLTPPSVKK
jgi:hypothetical protein